MADHRSMEPIIRWLLVSLAAATLMLLGVLAVATSFSGEYRQPPMSGPPFIVGSITDVAKIFGENVLVLMLYATGCLAAFAVDRRRGEASAGLKQHELTRRLTLTLIIGLLAFSACRQAYVLGDRLAGYSGYF